MYRALPSIRRSIVLGAACWLISACGETAPEIEQQESAVSGTRYGVDYSFARPSPASLAADGFTFAVRYFSHDSGKNLTASEARALIAAGLDVVSNWESTAESALGGHAQGVADAQAADAQHRAVGAPASRPIYFSVDFDATPGQQAAINAYFDGVASVIGRERTGAYGGYYVIKRLFDAGKITWGWQTYAWSGGQWDPRAQLRQIQNGILGGSCDKDQAMTADFGQWGHAAEFAGQSLGVSSQSYPIASAGAVMVKQGQTVTGWIKLKNVGTKTWMPGVVKLAPIPRDHDSPYASPSWLSPTRISTVSAPVAPGEVGRFELDITGHSVGQGSLKLGWVAEGITWFADHGGGPPDGYFEVKVDVVPDDPPSAADGGAGEPDAVEPPDADGGSHVGLDAQPTGLDAQSAADAGPRHAPDAGHPGSPGTHTGVSGDDGGVAAGADGNARQGADGGAAEMGTMGGCSTTAGRPITAGLAPTSLLALCLVGLLSITLRRR